MTATMDTRIPFKAESKRRKVCKLQYADRGGKDNGAITTLLIPSLNEDRKRASADEAFDRQIHGCHNIYVDGVALVQDDTSAAKKFRAAFIGKRVQPGLVNFLVRSGRPGVLHDRSQPKINTAFSGKYIFLPLEPTTKPITYRLQKDGSVIVTTAFSGAYIEHNKIYHYPEDENGQKPQISRVNTRIAHKVEMRNGKPHVSIIERHVSIESENIKEANTMGRLLAKKMGLTSNPIVNLFSTVFKRVKNLVIKRYLDEPTGATHEKAGVGPALFVTVQGNWNLSQVRQPAKTAEHVMPASQAYKGAGLFGGHQPAQSAALEPIGAIAASQSSVQKHLGK